MNHFFLAIENVLLLLLEIPCKPQGNYKAQIN